jgi:hypothetical protein
MLFKADKSLSEKFIIRLAMSQLLDMGNIRIKWEFGGVFH